MTQYRITRKNTVELFARNQRNEQVQLLALMEMVVVGESSAR